jgi:sulfatase maturation enzyme AslB (radical SAM superfamily)
MEEIEKPIKRLEFVVKISKYCNLRCRYCYEMNDLDKKDEASFNSEETCGRFWRKHQPFG